MNWGYLFAIGLLFSSYSAYANKSCYNAFRPSLKLVEANTKSDQVISKNGADKSVSGASIRMLEEYGVIKDDIGVFKLHRLMTENPFMYQTLDNIAGSRQYLERLVEQNYTRQIRAIDMAYAGAVNSTHVIEGKPSSAVNKAKQSSKVIDFAKAREERIEEEKKEYETYINKEFSEENYGFFLKISELFTILHEKLNESATVQLSTAEHSTLKEISEQFNVYTNYLLAKETLVTFHKVPKDTVFELMTVMTRSPVMHHKIIEYLSYMERALSENRQEDVLSSEIVEKTQKQLLKEIKDFHLPGSEKRYIEIIHFLEGRM